jgi:hypothetical protein
LRQQDRKLEKLPSKKKNKLLKTLKKKLAKFNKKSNRKLFLGDVGSALGANGGAGAGLLGAGAGLAMATMGSEKEEEEERNLESEMRSGEMALMVTINKRSAELGTLENRVSFVIFSYMRWILL